MRLVLLPVLYNAMADTPELHNTPLFQALHSAMLNSTYEPLVHLPAVECTR